MKSSKHFVPTLLALAAAACSTSSFAASNPVDSATLMEAARESIASDIANAQARARNETARPAVAPMLRAIARQARTAGTSPAAARAAAPAGFTQSMPALRDGRVLIEVIPRDDAAAVVEQLRAAGAVDISAHESLVTAWVRADAADQLGSLTAATSVRASLGKTTNAGSVDGQGDVVQRSNQSRFSLGLSGRGTSIGIISDSFNVLGGQALGVATGNLPGPSNPFGLRQPVKILKEGSGPGLVDEGRAMAEIIHDIVSGSQLSFYAPVSYLDLAVGVRALADAGATVVVDDLTFFGEPFFQQTPAGAVAAELAVTNRAVVISSAGNFARNSVEDPFRPAASRPVLSDGASLGNYRLHRFADGQVTVPITLRGGAGGLTFILQWDDPFKSASPQSTGAVSDLDLFVFTDPQGVNAVLGGVDTNAGGDAIEGIGGLVNTSSDPANVVTAYLGVGLRDGSPLPRNLKILAFGVGDPSVIGGRTIFNKGTIVGHANEAAYVTSCAVRWDRVGNGTNALVEDFSSSGTVLQRLDTRGSRLTSPRDTRKPDVCSPDGVNTSFFAPFGSQDFDNDGLPNFFGTSASAPHLAGIVAQMQQVTGNRITPIQVKQALLLSATDMDNPITTGPDAGYDNKTGYGFVFAPNAVSRAQQLVPR